MGNEQSFASARSLSERALGECPERTSDIEELVRKIEELGEMSDDAYVKRRLSHFRRRLRGMMAHSSQ